MENYDNLVFFNLLFLNLASIRSNKNAFKKQMKSKKTYFLSLVRRNLQKMYLKRNKK